MMKIEDVWSAYRARIKAFLQSKVSNPDDVEDLLQEILIKTYSNLETIKSDQSIKYWLYQIANHTIIDFYRKKGTERNLDTESLWYGEDDTDIQESLSLCIAPFIHALPTEAADMLSAIDMQGQSQKAYAENLGISYSTLKSRVQKARNQLRQLFEDCCHLSLDKYGNITDFETKSKKCIKC